jgi:hypothetical protein
MSQGFTHQMQANLFRVGKNLNQCALELFFGENFFFSFDFRAKGALKITDV